MKVVLLIATVFAIAAAFASDCERRLSFPFSSLMEKALNQGVVSLADVRRLAESSVPYNPIELEASRSTNAAFKRAIAAQHGDGQPIDIYTLNAKAKGRK